MTSSLPVIAFLLAVVLPVFFSRIGSAPVWLAVQAATLAWAVAQDRGAAPHATLEVLEALIIRALAAPWLVRRAIRRRGEPNLDLMPSNLFTWAIAVALVVLAFEFAASGVGDGQSLTLGAVGATVSVSLLILSTNSSPLGQLVALLVMENGLALFESLLPEPWPLPVHAALSGIFLLTVGVGGWLVGTADPVVALPAAPQARDAS